MELCEEDSSLNILSSTLKLKKLRLSLRRNELHYSDSESLCFFKKIEAGCIWPCLKELEIKGLFISNQNSFLELLQRHRNALKALAKRLQNTVAQRLVGGGSKRYEEYTNAGVAPTERAV